MPWKVTTLPAKDSPLHVPSPKPSYQLPKSLYRTVKYAALLLFLLISAYTLSLLPFPPAFLQPTLIPANHAFLTNTTSLSPLHSPQPIIGKVTASFGPRDPVYDSAIASHSAHNDRFGYPHFILRQRLLPGLWTKHAALLTVIGSELAKPESQRLKWVMWHDRDVLLMNANVPLDVFLPPKIEGFERINLLVTRDRNGLNNGVFMIRVSDWSIKLFASALSVREYERGVELKYSEQSGMERVIQRPWWSSSVAYVPQRWFNGFPPSSTTTSSSSSKSTTNSTSSARPGSLLIHFASNRDGKRPERMAYWSDIAQKELATDEAAENGLAGRKNEWNIPYNETGYAAEIKEYWERVGRNESMEVICKDIGGRGWD